MGQPRYKSSLFVIQCRADEKIDLIVRSILPSPFLRWWKKTQTQQVNLIRTQVGPIELDIFQSDQ